MAIPIRKIGHSLLESLLFLAVLGASSAFIGFFPGLRDTLQIPPYVYLPVLTALASAVVAFAFPKPTFVQAFLKLFVGGLMTFLIFVVLVAILGTAVFDVVLGFFWDSGAAVWSWTSPSSIVAAIFSIIAYIFLALVVVGLFFAALFAFTNVGVLMVMNLFIKRNETDDDSTLAPPSNKPFT